MEISCLMGLTQKGVHLLISLCFGRWQLLFYLDESKIRQKEIGIKGSYEQTEKISKKCIATEFITGCFKMSLHIVSSHINLKYVLEISN